MQPTSLSEFGQIDQTGDPATFVTFLDAACASASFKQYKQHLIRALDVKPGRRILDVGCGDGVIGESEGVHLHELLAYGARPEDLFGIDLQPEAIARGRALLPGATLSVGSAESLPYPDGFFDLVAQSTVFSSILDDIMRRRVAAEMRRVVRPGGLILWYDFRVNNPWNPDIRRVTRPEVRALFEGCACRFRASTLAHPLARVVARYTWLGAYLLERVPWLRTHDLAAIRPTGDAT